MSPDLIVRKIREVAGKHHEALYFGQMLMRLYLLENTWVVPTQDLCLLSLLAYCDGDDVEVYAQENGILLQGLRDLYHNAILPSQPAGYAKPDATGWGRKVFLYTSARMLTDLNNNVKEHWRLHMKNFFMGFFHWKSHEVAYKLAGSDRARNALPVGQGPLFHPYPGVNLDEYFHVVPLVPVNPAAVPLVPVDPWVDHYPRDPWNDLSHPDSLKLFVKNLVSDLFPVPDPTTGNYPHLKNTQAQYSFFRGFITGFIHGEHNINNYEDFLEFWREDIAPDVGVQLALHMQEGNAVEYLPVLLQNTIFVESGRQLYKVNQLVPQTQSLIPGHFQMDTAALIELFIPAYHPPDRQGRTKTSFKDNIPRDKAHLWNLFFKTDMPIFRKDRQDHYRDYSFRHTVMTDGWSVTILLVADRYKNRRMLPHVSTRGQRETYVQDLTEAESLLLLPKPLILGLDPNCRDHLFVCATSEPGGHTWRYTSQQRLKESKSKPRKKRREKRSRRTKVPTPQGAHVSVAAFQSNYLIGLNQKSHVAATFRSVIARKTTAFKMLSRYYSELSFRKDRLRSYAGLQVTETKLIQSFTRKFLRSPNRPQYNPTDCVIMWGDWRKPNGFRGQGPVPNVRYRKLFKRAGITVLLVNEHRTSITCSRCAYRPLLHCREYPDPRPQELPHPDPWPNVTAWGLLKCANCHFIWNRDVNASINIRNIGLFHLEHRVRPRYLGYGDHMGF